MVGRCEVLERPVGMHYEMLLILTDSQVALAHRLEDLVHADLSAQRKLRDLRVQLPSDIRRRQTTFVRC